MGKVRIHLLKLFVCRYLETYSLQEYIVETFHDVHRVKKRVYLIFNSEGIIQERFDSATTQILVELFVCNDNNNFLFITLGNR